jgi:hypothetical protein
MAVTTSTPSAIASRASLALFAAKAFSVAIRAGGASTLRFIGSIHTASS